MDGREFGPVIVVVRGFAGVLLEFCIEFLLLVCEGLVGGYGYLVLILDPLEVMFQGFSWPVCGVMFGTNVSVSITPKIP